MPEEAARPEPTVTPLSTSTPPKLVVSGARVDVQAELALAQQAIDDGMFSDAVQQLQRAAAEDQAAAQPLLAMAYLGWGRSVLDKSGVGPVDVDLARERFVSGLAVAPNAGQASQDLQTEITHADGYLELAQLVERLKLEIAAEQTEQAQATAGALLEQLNQPGQQPGAYPPLAALTYDAYLAAGDALLAADEQAQARRPISVLPMCRA